MEKSVKTAIVTGSAKGLGAATALKLAKRGVNVVVNYSKSKQDAEKIADLCTKEGVETLCLPADISNDVDCRRIVRQTKDAWGRIDILVNNAGTTQFADYNDLDSLSAEDFHGVYSTNVVGPYQMVRAVRPIMKAQGYGSIVNVSSLAALSGLGSSIAYATSKGALNTLTLALARALAPEIRVNAVCPGFISTSWFDERYPGKLDKIISNIEETTPLKRAATPEEIADTVVFLCLEGAINITGETIITDSGNHLVIEPVPSK